MIETGMLSDEQCREVLNWLIDEIETESNDSDFNVKTAWSDAGRNWSITRRELCNELLAVADDEVKRIVYGTED